VPEYRFFNEEEIDIWRARNPPVERVDFVLTMLGILSTSPDLVPGQRLLPGSVLGDRFLWVPHTNVILVYRIAEVPKRAFILKPIVDLDLWAQDLGMGT
jgi:hypothetical protein